MAVFGLEGKISLRQGERERERETFLIEKEKNKTNIE
jgi:hypothetical protein